MDRPFYSRGLLAVLALVVNASSHAADPGLTLPGPGTPEIGRMIVTLLLMVAAFAGLAWWMRRLGGKFGGLHHAALKIRASLALGTRERLVVLQVGESHLLLGITAQQITKLHELTDADVAALGSDSTGDFAARFRKALHKDEST
ncbi:MAG: flagellar biosynthetic protein FliO [Thiotrichales bacterium]